MRAGQGTFSRVYKSPDTRHIFLEWEANENALRERLGDVAILRDRRGGQTIPLPLEVLRAEIDKGREQQIGFPDEFGACGCMVEMD